ncbi:Crp/Fnr family transcriptional regulator [Thiohalomonas denitrificans]|uniref:Crp/Fnr family transcriptional regulator n=1 Tax=Thiohalomonas denitrificans TaxID=415747 RepID=UPI0026F0F4DE|nr:Crp/Fnr family transcriptional regulator [Thiohalomonas denitrificans]
MTDSIAKLFTTIEQLTPFSAAAGAAFADALKPVHFAKTDYLLRAGESNANLYFVAHGLVRFVYTTEDGREYNKSFAAEGQFVGCMRSILARQPCRFSIQALEETETLALGDAQRTQLWQQYPEWERLGRLLAEQVALKTEAREAEFLLDSTETRYLNFLAAYPRLAKRIPQYHIASYLGITDVALSRIRTRIKAY